MCLLLLLLSQFSEMWGKARTEILILFYGIGRVVILLTIGCRTVGMVLEVRWELRTDRHRKLSR